MTAPPEQSVRPVALIGLFLGPVVAAAVYLLLPAGVREASGELTGGLDHPARATAALASWMAVWWLTEAIPISATALLPLVCLPLFGVASIRDAAAPYARDLILLFFGGFILGLALARCNLHRRIALFTLSLVGDSPGRLVAGFMLATAVMSMWVSNTATAMLMLPIALSVLSQLTDDVPEGDAASAFRDNFARCLLLGIAYAASIGGVATLVGTPPNLVLAAFVRDQYGADITMAHWMLVMVPLAAVFLPLVWLGLTRFIFPIHGPVPTGAGDAREMIRSRLKALGRMSRAEWTVAAVFAFTALAWITRPLLNTLGESLGWPPLAGLNDASIAVLSAMLLFVIPTNLSRREFAMDWKTAETLPWGILILFGGGLSLAAAITATGLDNAIGGSLAGLAGVPPIVAILAVTTAIVFLTELTSNTAIATAVLPVLAAAAPAIGVDPGALLIPAAIGASFAFMLPVATPPNAIVFGSGHIHVGDMARAGFVFNLIGIALATLAAVTFAGYILPPGATLSP